MFKRLGFKALSRLFLQPWHRQTRGLTLGTRTVVIDDGKVLLVRHSYAPGWMFPGGGVERGESLVEAALRELREEAGIVAEEEPALHGLFLNDRQFPGDHVACFVLRRFKQQPVTKSLEIAEARFFPLGALPGEATGGTRRRLEEIASRGKPARDRQFYLTFIISACNAARHDPVSQLQPATTRPRNPRDRSRLNLPGFSKPAIANDRRFGAGVPLEVR